MSLPKINATKPCPKSPQYWTQPGTERKLAEMPDCQHELGFQFLWSELSRYDLVQGKVAKGVTYGVDIFHAAPDAILSNVATAQLHSVSVSAPPKHHIPDMQASIEVTLRHSGRWETDIVMFLKGVREAGSSQLVSWLMEDDEDKPECSWMQWIRSWFACPISRKKLLPVENLLHGKTDVYHYNTPGCAETFVVAKAMEVDHQQLEHFHKSSIVTQLDKPRSWSRPRAVAIGLGLLPENTFTVFNAHELLARKLHYGMIFAGGAAFTVCCFLIARWRLTQEYEAVPSDGHKTMMSRVSESGMLQCAMIMDHWLTYMVAMVLPWYAFNHGYINRRSGTPWEYHGIFAVWLFVHCLHELYWFSNCAVKGSTQVSYFDVAKGSIVGPLALLDFYLDIQFICIARLFGSKLADFSLLVFMVSNILLQLCFFSLTALARDGDVSIFKCRGFEVLHAVLIKDIKEEDEQSKVQASSQQTVLFSLMKFAVEDVSQAVLQILFVFWYGGSPIVYCSISVSITLSFLGLLSSIAEAQDLKP